MLHINGSEKTRQRVGRVENISEEICRKQSRGVTRDDEKQVEEGEDRTKGQKWEEVVWGWVQNID